MFQAGKEWYATYGEAVQAAHRKGHIRIKYYTDPSAPKSLFCWQFQPRAREWVQVW